MLKIILILFLPFTIYSQNMWEMRAWVSGNVDKFEVVDTNNIYCISDKGLTNYLDKSTDGGKSWFLVNDLTKYEVNGALDIEVIDSIIFISFFSNGVILKSTDYGKTFEKIELPDKSEVRNIVMFDKENGIAAVPLKVYKTRDGWKTYDTITLDYTDTLHSHYNFTQINSTEMLYQVIISLGDDYGPFKIYLQK